MKKTALITGASRGIGAAIALKLAQNNFFTVINYRSNKAEAEKIAESTGGISICTDVSDIRQVEKMVNDVIEKTSGIDVLVNNAGISVTGLFTDITPEQEQELWRINVGGAFNCTRCVLPYMINKKHGKIINISSMWGQTGASCEVHYSASKAAIIGFTKALAKEVGPSGINVNCICPGVILTDMNSGFDNETLDMLKNDTPLERLGTPGDIAQAAAFFASESSDFITGQILGVNGGFVI